MDSQQRKIAEHIQRMKIVMGRKKWENGSKFKTHYFLKQIEKGRVLLQKSGAVKKQQRKLLLLLN